MAREIEMEATGFLHLARLGIVPMLSHPLSKLPPCHLTICGSLLVNNVVVKSKQVLTARLTSHK